MGDLFQELKRRNLFKVGMAYAVLSWFLLQVGSVLAPIMNLPEVVLSVVVFFLILGFPLALLFAWAFEMTPEGIKRTTEVEPSNSATADTGKKLNLLTSSLLVAVIVLVGVDRFLLSDETIRGRMSSGSTQALGDRVYESIAVLPFVNMSDDKSQEYFSDGISEELLNLLAKTKGLRVAARTSSFAFKGQNQNIKKIGENLDVQTVLEGSVRKANTRLRVTAQLIDVDTGFHLWSETYDRELDDVFAIQDEISAAIVGALQVHFGGEAVAAPTQSYQPDLVAYEHYLKGQELIKNRTKKDIEAAREEFAKAIETDARFAAAYAGKADAFMLLSERQGAYGDIPVKYAIEFSEPLVALALELDPDLPEAHNSHGFLLHSQGDKEDEALVAYDRAIELRPSFALAHMWRSQLLDDMKGEIAAAPALEMAYKLDPMSPLIVQNFAMRLIDLRQFDRAAYLATKLEEIAPDKAERVAFVRARIDMNQGRFAKAYARMEEHPKDLSVIETNKAIIAWKLKNSVEFFEHTNSFMKVWWYFGLNQPADAFSAMEDLPESLSSGEFGQWVQYNVHLMRGKYEEAFVIVQELGWADKKDGGFFDGDPGDIDSPEFAFLLQQLGRDEEANNVLSRTDGILANAEADGYGFSTHLVAAKVAVLRGDHEKAIFHLEKHDELDYLDWIDRNHILFRPLKGNTKFEALFDGVYSHVNAEREKLGWEPLERSAFLPEKDNG